MSTPNSFSESGHAGVSSWTESTTTNAHECRHSSVNAPTGWELYLPWLAQRPTGTPPNQSRDSGNLHSGGNVLTPLNWSYESPSYSTAYVFNQTRRPTAAGAAVSPAPSSGFVIADMEYTQTPDLPTFSPAHNRAVNSRVYGYIGLGLYNVPQLANMFASTITVPSPPSAATSNEPSRNRRETRSRRPALQRLPVPVADLAEAARCPVNKRPSNKASPGCDRWWPANGHVPQRVGLGIINVPQLSNPSSNSMVTAHPRNGGRDRSAKSTKSNSFLGWLKRKAAFLRLC